MAKTTKEPMRIVKGEKGLAKRAELIGKVKEKGRRDEMTR